MASPLFQSHRSVLDFYSAGWNQNASAIWSMQRSKRTNGSVIGKGRLFGTHSGIYYIDANDYSRQPSAMNFAPIVSTYMTQTQYRHEYASTTGSGTPRDTGAAGIAGQDTYVFRVPNGVTTVSVLCIGGGGGAAGTGGNYGGGGGGGGGLRWYNNFPVTPGDLITVNVGHGGAGGYKYNGSSAGGGYQGGESSFIYNSVKHLYAEGGGGGSTPTSNGGTKQANTGGSGGQGTSTGGNVGGYNGGTGGNGSWNAAGGGGGAPGAYGANGANGVTQANTPTAGNSGTGGGAGTGAHNINGNGASGGIGPYGVGQAGPGGALPTNTSIPAGGYHGSWQNLTGNPNANIPIVAWYFGGPDQDADSPFTPAYEHGAAGGWYGGGGSADGDDTIRNGGAGGMGAVRIVWGGGTFPSTNVYNANNEITGN